MGLGNAQDVTLAEAREAAASGRKRVRNLVDPIADRICRKAAQAASLAQQETFGDFADRYVEQLRHSKKTVANWERTVKAYAQSLRSRPISAINAAEVANTIRPVLSKTPEAGRKALQHLEAIFEAARVANCLAGDSPARWKGNLEHLLDRPAPLSSKGHRRALPSALLPDLMTKIRAKETTGARALELAILTALRPSEAAGAEWQEIDLDNKVWNIPGSRMKEGLPHRVPLSDGVLALLKTLRPAKPKKADVFVFPGTKVGKPINAAAMLKLVASLGMKELATPHGFRSTFRDWVGDHTDFHRELAEHALAHKVGSDVETAYRRGDALEKRMPLMNSWANFCAGHPHTRS